jgi:hypothetical protein
MSDEKKTIARVEKHAGEYELCVVVQSRGGDLRHSHEDYKLTIQELRELQNSINRLLEV